MTKLICLVLLMTYATGCATMFRGTTDQISVRSNEPGTKIYIDEMEVGTDSTVWSVPKRGSHTIRVSKQGCTDVMRPIPYSFDGVSLLGILIDFGLVSMLLVDGVATGAITKADQTAFVLTPSCPTTTERVPAASK